MTIREATLEDSARLVEMAIRFLTETPMGEAVPPAPLKLAQLVLQVLDVGVIFVAEVNGRLEGFIALVALEHPMSGEAYADELAWWVEPEARSRSIGPRLLSRAEDWCRQNALSFLKMVAPIGSGVATAYLRLGYQEIETSFMKRFGGGPVQQRRS